MPKSTKLSELIVEEASGVDHPAHLHEGWIVMKSTELDEALDSLSGEETHTSTQGEPKVELTQNENLFSLRWKDQTIQQLKRN